MPLKQKEENVMGNLYNNYLFIAIESYPYELEKAVEALNYALAYEPDNVKALCLMARVYSEQLSDYETAKVYYEKALASNMGIREIYPDYIRLLINNEDFDEAEKLIDFAFTIKGVGKANIFLAQATLYEATLEFEKAVTALNEAKMYGLNNDFYNYIDNEISRVNKKNKMQKNKAFEEKKTPEKEVKKVDKGWFKNRLNNLL